MERIFSIYLLIALLPLLTGFLVIKFMIYYSKKEYSARNISPSYFAAVALLFALFASLIFGEVWNRISTINMLMLKQASALRGILRIAETLPASTMPYQKAVEQYIVGIKKLESNKEILDNEGKSLAEKISFSGRIFHPLYALVSDSTLFEGNTVARQVMLQKTEELRTAWFERKEYLKQRILPEKLLILFLMGFFTQVSIAFSHLGNNRAIRDTVWLFSFVFFAALAILISIDNTEITRHFISISALEDVL